MLTAGINNHYVTRQGGDRLEGIRQESNPTAALSPPWQIALAPSGCKTSRNGEIISFVPNDDESIEKKVSDLTLSEVLDQLQILEYMATNTPQGLTEGDRRFREELEEREKLLLRDRSTDPKLEDLEKSLADRQARESHDLAPQADG
jgi:hypothetical protein